MSEAGGLADGFSSGVGLVLTVFKIWLAGALAATIASAAAPESVPLAIMLAALVVAITLPFVRLRWLGDVRDGLRPEAAAEFRAGLIIALVVSIAFLWAGMAALAAISSEAAPGGRAAIPSTLNWAVGLLVLASSVLGGVVLFRLQRRISRGNQWG